MTEREVIFFYTDNKLFDNKYLNNGIQRTLYPESYHHGNNICGALLLYNLAEPEWITINCDEPLTYHVFCMVPKENVSTDIQYQCHGQIQETVIEIV